MGNFSKLIAAVVGVALPWAASKGLDLTGYAEAIAGILQIVLAPALVYLAPANRPTV